MRSLVSYCEQFLSVKKQLVAKQHKPLRLSGFAFNLFFARLTKLHKFLPYDQRVFDKSLDNIFSGKKIPGYYSVGGPTEKDRNRLNLGLSIEEVASLFLDEVKDFIPFEDITQIISIDYAMTEKIIFSEIDKKSLYLTVPVSLDDFMFQLYWYGYDFQFDVLNDRYEMVKDPEGGHEVGTHPTQEEVDEINKTYPDNHVESESSKINYRDFHALTLGLKKN